MEGKVNSFKKARSFDPALIIAIAALLKELLPLAKDIVSWMIEMIKELKKQSSNT
jgi:hypothetical protein